MKKTPKHILTASALLAGLVGFSSIAQATLWDNGGTGSDWSTAANWDGDVVPGASDLAVIGDGNTANATGTADYTTGTTTVQGLSVGTNGSANGTLNVTGGTLTVSNTSGLNVGTNNTASGTVNINGGNLAIQQANSFIGSGTFGAINLIDGSLTNASGGFTNLFMANGGGNAEVNISGGSLSNIRMTLGVQQTISVTGDAAAIDFENWSFSGGTTNFDLTAGTTGISLLDVNFWNGTFGTENLIVDISGYDVSNGTSLDLIENQFATFDNTIWDSISIVGGTGDLTYTATSFGTRLSIDNITVVPEPSTYALIGGCLALSAVMLRRRR